MQLNEYQEAAQETAIYPILGHPIVYPALGLNGEAGEVAEKVKKIMRDDKGVITESKRYELCKELGDCLWYIAETARQADLTLEEIALCNIAKLKSRSERNAISGSGDNR